MSDGKDDRDQKEDHVRLFRPTDDTMCDAANAAESQIRKQPRRENSDLEAKNIVLHGFSKIDRKLFRMESILNVISAGSNRAEKICDHNGNVSPFQPPNAKRSAVNAVYHVESQPHELVEELLRRGFANVDGRLSRIENNLNVVSLIQNAERVHSLEAELAKTKAQIAQMSKLREENERYRREERERDQLQQREGAYSKRPSESTLQPEKSTKRILRNRDH